MKFDKLRWQAHCRNLLKPMGLSYAKLAHLLKIGKSTAWNILSDKHALITVEHFLLISRYLGVNALDFIVVDEIQLKLL